MKPKGYLVFTTHDGDEIDATFVPESETEIIEALKQHVSDDAVLSAFGKWAESQGEDLLKWDTQTRCQEPWPFNDHHILGTFYHLVY